MNQQSGHRANPFPGLRPFNQQDHPFFFGRDEAVDEVLERMVKNRSVALIGPSGSGKSSLMRAGVVPAIAGGALGGTSSHWNFASLRPGNDPIGNLAHALENVGIQNADRVLRTSSQALIELTRRSTAPGKHLLVIVDQFEELFRFRQYAQSEDSDLFATLLAAVAHSDAPVHLVITMFQVLR